MEPTRIGIFLVRLFVGIWFLLAGIEKIVKPWSAEGFLVNTTKGSPLHNVFLSMNISVVNALVVWGLVLIGIAMILGMLVRLAAYSGMIMQSFFWIAKYPWEHGPFQENLMLVMIFLLFILAGAGNYYGLDGRLQQRFKKFPWLNYLLG